MGDVDTARVEASVAEGGLAVFAEDGVLLLAAPPNVTNSLRFFLSRLWQAGEVGFPPTMAVTSALAGEGVTVRCSQCRSGHRARSRSQRLRARDQLVVHAPTAPRWIGVPVSPTCCRAQCTVDEALVHTSDDRLVLLTPGYVPIAARPGDGRRQRLHRRVEAAHEGLRCRRSSTPRPILKAAEATTVVRHADAATLVVKQGVTTERQLAMAIAELTGIELGVIINRSSTRVPKLLRRFTPPT